MPLLVLLAILQGPAAGLRPDHSDRAAGWHALDVRLKRVKGDVLARPGYWRCPTAP